MRQERNALRAARVRRAVKTQQMQRRAIRGTHLPSLWSQGIAEVCADAFNQVVARSRRRKQGTQEGFAHGQASAPASGLATLLDEAGSERLMRSRALQIGCPQ